MRVGGEASHVDIVHEIEEIARIDVMLRHQAGERGAVIVEEALLDAARLFRLAAYQAADIFAHALVDEREQVARGGVKAVVEVEHPRVDVGELGRQREELGMVNALAVAAASSK
jgi:hypothetical protein